MLAALVGIGANTSMAAGRAIAPADLVPDLSDLAPSHPPPIWQTCDPSRYPFLKGAKVV